MNLEEQRLELLLACYFLATPWTLLEALLVCVLHARHVKGMAASQGARCAILHRLEAQRALNVLGWWWRWWGRWLRRCLLRRFVPSCVYCPKLRWRPHSNCHAIGWRVRRTSPRNCSVICQVNLQQSQTLETHCLFSALHAGSSGAGTALSSCCASTLKTFDPYSFFKALHLHQD